MSETHLSTGLVGVLEVASRDDAVGIDEASRHILRRHSCRDEKREAAQPLAELPDLLDRGLLTGAVLRDAYGVAAPRCNGQVL